MPYKTGSYVPEFKGFELIYYSDGQDPHAGRVIGHTHLEFDAAKLAERASLGEEFAFLVKAAHVSK